MRKEKKIKILKSAKAVNVVCLTLPFRLQSGFAYEEKERNWDRMNVFWGSFEHLRHNSSQE
jgi:hypothetical protein